jgi:hypothetical protein
MARAVIGTDKAAHTSIVRLQAHSISDSGTNLWVSEPQTCLFASRLCARD